MLGEALRKRGQQMDVNTQQQQQQQQKLAIKASKAA
jgi:hypothetical protein